MSDDLVKRGKALAYHMRESKTHDDVDAKTAQEMADRIQELEAEVGRRLRTALENVIDYVPDGACEASGYFAADFARALSDADKVLSEHASQVLGDSNG